MAQIGLGVGADEDLAQGFETRFSLGWEGCTVTVGRCLVQDRGH